MRVNWKGIRFICLMAVITGLMAFSWRSNNAREIREPLISFKDEAKPYVTRGAVNKLLIQNKADVTGQAKEKLDLKKMELLLDNHPMISNADVYSTVQGDLKIEIVQRQPIARVSGNTSYYIDREGGNMPLSDNFSARVPIVTGINTSHHKKVFELMKSINNNAFLQGHIVGISRKTNGDYHLEPRAQEYTIILGGISQLESKFYRYIAFFEKAKKDKKLGAYRSINLKYKGQVVCKNT